MTLRLSLAFATAIIMAPGGPAVACDSGALGTARILPVGTEGGLQIGLKSYPRTLPLHDHEVVLTFDDGPEPATTAKILDALAKQCVRATFFAIGRKVEQSPDLARREVAEGHTVAYHTYSHPQPTMRAMSAAAARADVARGAAAVEKFAYGEDIRTPPDDLSALKLHAPFFRFPGFAETADLRRDLAANNIATFGTDLWAADWNRMTPQRELSVIIGALDHAGRGMILLHDDKPWTAAMLPDFLRALKSRGYRVVHIVAGEGRGETAPAPKGWKAEAPP